MIKINSLHYNYEDGTKALVDINFDLNKGRAIGVIGANGSGKSTLFLNIIGILHPTNGRVLFKGNKIEYDKKSLRKYRKKVTMVFQDPEKQLFYSKVYDDVAFVLRNLDYSEEAIKEKVENALKLVNALDLVDKPTHFLSYGQKKRVAIAGSLVLNSEVLLLDEPTSGLDPNMTKEMIKIINGLKIEKKLIVSSHNMDFIYEICDYIYVLSEGRIVGEGTPEEVFTQSQLIEKALLDKPWLVKIHEKFGLPLYKNEEDFNK
ncbi:MAG: ATP-binding cassette domain-containing protein [Tissierellia bacterium]|nr:ATP-binding cassette domain-containing protein [Tissierellia bacterium]